MKNLHRNTEAQRTAGLSVDYLSDHNSKNGGAISLMDFYFAFLCVSVSLWCVALGGL